MQNSRTLRHTQSWHLVLFSQCRWGCRSDLMRCVYVCVRVVIVEVIVTLLVNPVLYNLSLPPISSPPSFQLSVYMYMFYSVNKMSHTCSILYLHAHRDNSRNNRQKRKLDLLRFRWTACTHFKWICIFVCIHYVFAQHTCVLHYSLF